MPIRFQCDCGQQYTVKDELAGKKTSCKACGEILQVPSPSKKGAVKRKPVEPVEEEWDEALPDEETDAPVKAKKKSKGKGKKRGGGESSGMSKGAIIALVMGGAVIGLGGIGFLIMKLTGGGANDGGGAAVAEAAPDPLPKMQAVKNELGSFAIDFPEGWEPKIGGGSGGIPPFASVKNGNVYLSVKSDPHASVLFAGNQTVAAGEMRLEDYPVHSAHQLVKMKMEGEYDTFEETEPKLITTPFGDGRISEFTAKEGLFTTSKGLRATFLSNSYSLKIICKCPQGEYAKNEALFRAVIQSFRR